MPAGGQASMDLAEHNPQLLQNVDDSHSATFVSSLTMLDSPTMLAKLKKTGPFG